MLRQTDYEAVFRHRGASYHKAMVDFPGVRSLEFQQLFLRHPLKPGEKVVDCPALGGYLEANVNVPVAVESLDFCPQGNGVSSVDEIGSIEGTSRVVCLAASHHIQDLKGFLMELAPTLIPGGILHLADVTEGSPVAKFLDEFVGQWTSTGHRGIWRNFNQEFVSGGLSGFTTKAVEERWCPWEFNSEEEMLQFCRLLFGLDLNPTDDQILEALEGTVETLPLKGNGRLLLWRLTYADLEKNA